MRHFTIVLVTLVVVQAGVIGMLGWRLLKIHGPIGRKRETAVVPFTQETLLRPESELSGFYEPKPGTKNEMAPAWLGGKIIHTINSNGLRDTGEYTVEKPNDTFRIVVMGDSFTYGLFVGDGETYSDKPEALLNNKTKCSTPKRFEVLNFGVPGYDAEMSAYRYRYRAEKYQPDLVLWYLIENDFNESASFGQSLWQDIKMMLAREGIPYDKFAQETSEILSSDTTLAFGDKAIPEHQAEKIGAWVSTMSVPAVIFSDKELPEKYQTIIDRAVSENARVTHMPNLTYTRALADGHPSPDSHRQIADEMFGHLMKHLLVPCGATR